MRKHGLRSRQKRKLHDGNHLCSVTINGSYLGSTDRPGPFIGKDSAMVDQIRGHKAQPCSHRTILVSAGELSHTYDGDWFNNGTVHIENYCEHLPVLLEDSIGLFEPDVSVEFNEFVGYASSWFRQQFRSKASLANYVYELKDIKQLLGRLGTGLWSRSLNGIRRAVHDEFKDRKESGIGGNFLDYTFNWKPLVEDAKKLLETNQEVSQRWKFLFEHSDYRDHYGRRISIEPGERGFEPRLLWRLTDHMVGYGFQSELWLEPNWCQVRMHAGATIENHLNLKSASYWDAIADQLGLNNSPKIVWNGLKLSWLVNFFIDSRDFWDAFEKQAFQGYLGVEETIFTRKIITVYDIVIKSEGATTSSSEVVGQLRVANYLRSLGSFQKGWLISLDKNGLDAGQIQILGALTDSLTKTSSHTIKGFQATFLRNRARDFGRRPWRRFYKK